MYFDIICAVDCNYGFGLYNDNEYKLPWNNKIDMKFFQRKTKFTENPMKQNAIIMGKNTWLSINKVLPERLNIVLTNSKINNDNLICVNEFDKCFELCKKNSVESIYVIGGCNLIHQLLNHSKLRYVYLNQIQNKYDCNISLKPILELKNEFKILNQETIEDVIMYKLENIIYKDEYNYLNLLKNILISGDHRNTRNSETLSVFGKHLSFNLINKLPILTTKKIFIRGIIEELIWFLKGSTNSKELENKKINIWQGNSNKNFINSMNLPYNEGDIGPMYGFNWNFFGAEYKGCEQNYEDSGYNQIKYCLDLLENDPNSRRIIMTTFDPSTANKGVLYPCHGIVIQFYIKEVDNIRYLSCNMYQRSADMFLGVPFNITSYSLLCYIFCEVLNNNTEYKYNPDKLNIYFGDCHIYKNHLDAVKEQLNNLPYIFPSVEFNRKITDIKEVKYEDINIINYIHHKSIKAEMIS